MIFLVEADEHLFDKNIGQHIDYPTESIKAFQKTNDRLKLLKKEYPNEEIGCIGLGDLEHKGFTDRGFRLKVQEMLRERQEITNNNSYSLLGDHSISTYGMSEYEYFVKSGFIKPSENLSIDGVNIYMVDRNKEPKDIIKNANGKLNIVLIHNYVRWEKSSLGNYGDDYILLDNNEAFENIDYILAGHIHTLLNFKGKVYGGKECEVIYPGVATRPTVGQEYEKCSWVIIDTKKQTVEQEYYDLPPLKEVFNQINIQIQKEKKVIKERITIKDILVNLDEYKIESGGIKDYIRVMKEVDENVKNKALEYIEKGENGK